MTDNRPPKSRPEHAFGPKPTLTADLFGLLSDETRVRIVGELYVVHQRRPSDPTLSFSALVDRVGVTDTGRFNYHLGRLRGTLVEKRENGYALTPAGNRLGSLLVDGDEPTCVTDGLSS